MPIKLTCPVCERSQIENNTCPNCETDLSTYGMLATLPQHAPVKVETKRRVVPIWLPVGIAILFFLLGLGLGFSSNHSIAQQQLQNTQYSTSVIGSSSVSKTSIDRQTLPIVKVAQPKLNSCGGFNYIVRQGDSLFSIARRFYGDSKSWLLISEANPTIQNQDLIKIDELLLIPNLKNACLNS